MSTCSPQSRRWLAFSLAFLLVLPSNANLPPNTGNATNSSDWMVQSFFWQPTYTPTQAVPVPVTQQCETVHFTWDRGAAIGPNPTAPYTLQIYTSAFVFPFVVDAGRSLSFDWQVPFGPGTLWQGCMFDSLGNTGGCQQIYTMIPGSSNCKNATFPLGPLDVDAQVDNGPLSQYGWIDQCTDIQLTPKNGTPPYVMTIAPSLHPPLNFTLHDMNPRNWTVSLSWASPFFISMVDAAGNFWANGPLHSGGGGTTKCLSNLATLPSPSTSSHSGIKAGAAIGAAFGGLIVGALAGLAAAFVFFQRRKPGVYTEKRNMDIGGPASPLRSVSSRNNLIATDSSINESSGPLTATSGGIFGRLRTGVQGTVQPFTERGQQRFGQKSQSGGEDGLEMQTSPTATSSDGASSSRHNQIYVVHHDGGRAPVTVYHADGTQVVELPPRYANDTSHSENDERSTPDEATSRVTRMSTTSGAATNASSEPPTDANAILSPVRRPSSISKPIRSNRPTLSSVIPEARNS